MTAKAENPNIVREYSIGNTQIKIADNYCSGKTREDVAATLRRIARNAQEHISVTAARHYERTLQTS